MDDDNTKEATDEEYENYLLGQLKVEQDPNKRAYFEGELEEIQTRILFAKSLVQKEEGTKIATTIDKTKEKEIKTEPKIEIPIVQDSKTNEENGKETNGEYYSTKGKKEKKVNNDNFANKGDKDDNNPYMYWKMIRKNYRFVCFRGEEILYWYDPKSGIYKLDGESLLKEMSQKISNESFLGLRKNHALELVELAKRDTMTQKPNEDELKYILLVGNGIIRTKDKDGKISFTPGFNSDYFIMSKVPWNYNPGTKCPKITRFLIELVVSIDICKKYPDTNELWTNIAYEDKCKVLTLVEFIGYCLYRGNDFKKMLILKGGPDSGKSKYTELVEKFLGNDSCSAVSLQEMRHEYNIAEIYGKMANIKGELSGKNLEDTSIIKIFINGDSVQGRVIRSRPVRFKPYAKLIFATNILPATLPTEDESFYGKLILIDCPNKFPRNDAFFDIMTTKEEMEGLLNWSLELLGVLMTNKRFSYEPDWLDIAKRFPRFGQGCKYDDD